MNVIWEVLDALSSVKTTSDPSHVDVWMDSPSIRMEKHAIVSHLLTSALQLFFSFEDLIVKIWL